MDPRTTIRCEQMEELAILYACGEGDAATRAAVETHVGKCAACAAVLLRECQIQQALVALDRPADSLDPTGLLLAQCRSELAEALDDLTRVKESTWHARWRRLFLPNATWNFLRHTLVSHPAMSMAVLMIFGFLAGVAGQRWHVLSGVPVRPVLTVSAAPKLTEQQLQSAGSANVSWVTPAGSREPTVQVQLMSQTPMDVVGSADDADIQRALTFVLTNGQRFEPEARLDSLEVLRTHSQDASVRRALCAAARNDRNPGVRIKALETLHGLGHDALVHQTILDALGKDSNSGVRVEAINLLLNTLAEAGDSSPADPQVLALLHDRLRNDSNNYIRLQSSAALRQLEMGELP